MPNVGFIGNYLLFSFFFFIRCFSVSFSYYLRCGSVEHYNSVIIITNLYITTIKIAQHHFIVVI